MSPNDAEGIANSVDPVQTAPLGAVGAVWSGSALFARHICPKTKDQHGTDKNKKWDRDTQTYTHG